MAGRSRDGRVLGGARDPAPRARDRKPAAHVGDARRADARPCSATGRRRRRRAHGRGDRLERSRATRDSRSRVHPVVPGTNRAELLGAARARQIERRDASRCPDEASVGTAPEIRGIDTLGQYAGRQAAHAGRAAREGRAPRLLDVLVHQLPADAPPPRGMGSRVSRSGAHDRRRAQPGVRVRARARQRARGGEASGRSLPGRARQRLRHVARVLEPVLARGVPHRPKRAPALPPLRRGQLRGHRRADPCAARRDR